MAVVAYLLRALSPEGVRTSEFPVFLPVFGKFASDQRPFRSGLVTPPAFLTKRDRPLWTRESARVARISRLLESLILPKLGIQVGISAEVSVGRIGRPLFPASREFTGKYPPFTPSRAWEGRKSVALSGP